MAQQDVTSAQVAGRRQGRRQEAAARFAPLEAKLVAPRPRPGLIKRCALVEALRASSAVPVVYVTAPAGYCKTTLMGHWAEADELAFAWVSLDDGDNDPLALLTYIALALNHVEPLGGPVFSALSEPEPLVDSHVTVPSAAICRIAVPAVHSPVTRVCTCCGSYPARMAYGTDVTRWRGESAMPPTCSSR